MYVEKIVSDIAWIARNFQNIEDAIFGFGFIGLDSSAFDVVDTNDNIPSIITTSDVEIVKLSRKRIVIN